MICAGIDAGSRTIKVVLLDTETTEVVDADITDQGVEQATLASELLRKMLTHKGLSEAEVVHTVATGYGRNSIVEAGQTITEITCHARGVLHTSPDVRTILDIGGQDSKVIRLNGQGTVFDFDMNDRCAAGTGRFLELVAERLERPLVALGELAAQSQSPAVISSMCVVFAETEIVGLLASGVACEDIAAGVQKSIASRVAAMVGRNVDKPVVFTGGVATVPSMREAMESVLGTDVTIAATPQMTGALGAAILAAENWKNGKA